MTLSFPMMETSAVLLAGSRIRLSIAGADFPVVWPPRGKFELTVDPEHSSLVLPTVPIHGDRAYLDIPESAPPPAPPVEDLVDESDWSVDREDEATIFWRHRRTEELQPTRGDLVYTTDQTWTVRVEDDDPGSTSVESTSELSLSRPGWGVVVRGSIAIAGRDSLQVDIELFAYYDKQEIWSKTWNESIPRLWA